MASAKLTKRVIDGLHPTAKTYRQYDAELKGFGVVILPSGLKSYIIEYRPDGGRNIAKKRMTLGRVGELTPDQARSIARDRLAEVRQGADPLTDRQTKCREMRLFEFINQWEMDSPTGRKSGQPMKPRTKAYMLARLRNHAVPILGKSDSTT